MFHCLAWSCLDTFDEFCFYFRDYTLLPPVLSAVSKTYEINDSQVLSKKLSWSCQFWSKSRYKHVSMLFSRSHGACQVKPPLAFFPSVFSFNVLPPAPKCHPMAFRSLHLMSPSIKWPLCYSIRYIAYVSTSVSLTTLYFTSPSSFFCLTKSVVVVRQGGLCLSTAVVWISASVCACNCWYLRAWSCSVCMCVWVCVGVCLSTPGLSLGGSPPLSSPPTPRDGCVSREFASEEKHLQLVHIKFCWANTIHQHVFFSPFSVFIKGAKLTCLHVCLRRGWREKLHRRLIWGRICTCIYKCSRF